MKRPVCLMQLGGAAMVILLAWTSTGQAGGDRLNIVGMGMGRTGVASSVGLEAVGVNPANLYRPSGPSVELAIVPLGAYVGSDFLSYDIFTTYFTGTPTDTGRAPRLLSESDKQDLLAAFEEGMGHAQLDAASRPLGVLVNVAGISAALSLTEHLRGDAALPRTYAEFLLYGNPAGSFYDFSRSAGAASWVREYALSVGFPLPSIPGVRSLRGGAALKLVHGMAYSELVRFNTRLATSEIGVLDGSLDLLVRSSLTDPLAGRGGAFSPFAAPAGSGFGMDLGLAGELSEGIAVGMSLTDLGSITWTRNIQEVSAVGALHFDNPLSASQRDSIQDAVDGEAREGSSFSTTLPTTLRAGVALDLHQFAGFRRLILGELRVALDIVQGLVEAPGTSTETRLSAGVEYKPIGILPHAPGRDCRRRTITALRAGLWRSSWCGQRGFCVGGPGLALSAERLFLRVGRRWLQHSDLGGVTRAARWLKRQLRGCSDSDRGSSRWHPVLISPAPGR